MFGALRPIWTASPSSTHFFRQHPLIHTHRPHPQSCSIFSNPILTLYIFILKPYPTSKPYPHKPNNPFNVLFQLCSHLSPNCPISFFSTRLSKWFFSRPLTSAFHASSLIISSWSQYLILVPSVCMFLNFKFPRPFPRITCSDLLKPYPLSFVIICSITACYNGISWCLLFEPSCHEYCNRGIFRDHWQPNFKNFVK